METKKEFIERVIDMVNRIPVNEVIGRHIKLYRKGPYYMGLCPFHDDHKIGSFIVTPDRGIWKCFAEDGVGGNGIDFWMKYHNVGFLDAVFQMATAFSLITPEEAKRYTKGNRLETAREAIRCQQEVNKKTRKDRNQIAEPIVVDAVFRAIPYVLKQTEPYKGWGSNLSPEHKAHLQKERKLTEKEMKDFITVPSDKDIFYRIYNFWLYATAAKKGMKNPSVEQISAISTDPFLTKIREQITRVPGFYGEKRTGRILFYAASGIAFFVKDDKEHILGMHDRRDQVKEGQSRYTWISSSFAEDDEKYEGGVSAGCPAGYIAHKVENHKLPPQLMITEGRFKAEKIAETGNDCIYLAGVGNWSQSSDMIRRNLEGRQHAYIMFDADMMGNTAVHKSMVGLQRFLRRCKWTKEFEQFVKDRGLSDEFLDVLASSMLDSASLWRAIERGVKGGQLVDIVREKQITPDEFEMIRESCVVPMVCLWPKSLGKGFDDFYNHEGNGFRSKMTVIKFNTFETSYMEAVKETKEKYNVKGEERIPKDIVEKYTLSLQENVEKRVIKPTA